MPLDTSTQFNRSAYAVLSFANVAALRPVLAVLKLHNNRMKVKPKNAANLLFSSTSLEYVYFEAIANSIDAGASQVTIAIQISSFTEPEALRISISDNGKGFDETNFNRFRAPRIISNLQGRCAHEKAAEEAAEQENLISTNDEIV